MSNFFDESASGGHKGFRRGVHRVRRRRETRGESRQRREKKGHFRMETINTCLHPCRPAASPAPFSFSAFQ